MTLPIRITGILLLAFLLAAGAEAANVSPSDPNLQYIGRWDDSDPTQPWAYAQGSTVIASFTGTSMAATFHVSSGEYFRVIIDDDRDSSTKVSFSYGNPLTLATGLAPGTHTLELIKETDVGRATLIDLEIDNGESIVPSPPRPSRRIMFYGDSNLAGYSLESERNQSGWSRVGCYHGLAGITARMFDAEYQNISRSGATISSLNDAYDRIDWSTSSPLWNFAAYPVDVVVVNIGANDYWRPKNQNKTRYHALLDDLRADHPAAHIMLFNAFGWEWNEPANYIHEVIAERLDPNMSWAVFPWVFEQYHGCETEHAGMAQYLAAHLTTITGWTASEPDVVSGYGQNGDVANGSFEEAAPFGGWGWRYFDDPGVSRVHDPAGAHDGNHYLRLENGASSHQTNPAGNGDVIALSMWMRGGSGGESVDVSISFRDQGGGGEINNPMQETTQAMTLSAEWKLYSMTVTAPTSPPDPVYSARVAFVAGSTDRVEIDSVAVGRPVPDIKANGSTDPLLINQGDSLTVDIALEPNNWDGGSADWWVLADTAFGWYRYNVAAGSFVPGLAASHQGPLFALGAYTVYSGTSLPAGTYTFYFGVDLDMNGSPDMDAMYLDTIGVTVQ